MASADVQGKFLWHELVTADPGAAGAFYGKVLGWTPQAWDKDPSYTVLLTPKGPVGGMMKPDSHAAGSSAQWLAYVGSANVEETAAAAQRLGGRILKGATDIPGGGGRYAVLADPQGAVFGIHTPPATGSASHAADAFTWHELSTSDHAAALRFYRELFGWEQLAVHDMGAMGPYVIFGRGGQQLGGMFTRQGGGSVHWLAYVRVSSASKAADAAKAAGGRLINGPHQVPGGSWIAQLADPHGAAIAVNQPPAPAESAQPARPAAKPPAAPAPAASTKPASPAPSPAAPERRPAAPPAPSAAPAPRPAAPAVPTSRPAAPAAPPAAPSKPAAPAQSSGVSKPAASSAPPPAHARPAAPAKAARKSTARKSAARKTAARGAGSRGRAAATRRKKAARPARKAAAAKKRSAKKGSAARSTRRAGGRAAKRSAGSRAGGRRAGAGARKTARGKRARRR